MKERPPRKFIVVLEDNQHPQVTFDGDYINKKELDLCIRALKKEQRLIIKKYRKDKIIADYELKKKGQVTDDARGTASTKSEGSGSKESRGTRSAEPAKATNATSTGRSSGTNPASISGLAGKVSGVTGVANPLGK